MKVEAAAWLEDGSCVCNQCPGEDENVQNEVHAPLFCQDHRVCELRKHFSFLFTPFFEDFSAAQPFLLQQVNNQLVHDFLSQQNNRLFSFSKKLAETRQQPISQTTWLKVTPHCNHCSAASGRLEVNLFLSEEPVGKSHFCDDPGFSCIGNLKWDCIARRALLPNFKQTKQAGSWDPVLLMAFVIILHAKLQVVPFKDHLR